MKRCLPILLAILTCAMPTSQADVITTFDFSEAIWNVSVSEFGNPVDASSGITLGGAGLLANRSGASGGSIYVLATLVGSISTVVFQKVALEFISDGSVSTAWDANTIFGSTTGDGFRISSSQGVDFSTVGANPTFEGLLDGTATSWTPTTASAPNLSPGPTDLEFSPAVDNGAVTNLTLQLQVNALSDYVRIRNFTLTGDPFVASAAVPEPGSFFTLVLICTGYVASRRSRHAAEA